MTGIEFLASQNRYGEKGGETSSSVRKLASLVGAPNAKKRHSMWMQLLGIEFGSISQVQFATNERECEEEEEEEDANQQARTISADCERSYFDLEEEKEKQEEKRRELERCLRSVFGGKKRHGGLRYYQGFHAVAQVVLSVVAEGAEGERGGGGGGGGGGEGATTTSRDSEEDANAKYKIACAILDRLASFSLRDNTRMTMYPTVLTLRIVLARVVELAFEEDETLREAVAFGAKKHEYQFALQKILTWHSMSADGSKRRLSSADSVSEREEEESRMECVKRLFDLFLATHPLMPVYLTVAVLLRERESIIRARHEFDDEDVMFSFLCRLETIPDLTSFEDNVEGSSEDISEAKSVSEHEKKKKMKQMMQKVRSVSFGSSSSLANMSPRKRYKTRELKKRQLQAVDALCRSALKLFSDFPPTQILRSNEMKTTFSGSSFDPNGRFPPRYMFANLSSPTPREDRTNDTEIDEDIHIGEQIEIRKAARLKRARLAKRKLFTLRRRVHALPFALRTVLFLLAYVNFWEKVSFIHRDLAYGPDIRIRIPRSWSVAILEFLLSVFLRLSHK